MVVAYFIFPLICYFLAKVKGKNPYIAFFIGFFIWPVFYYAFVQPDKRLKPYLSKRDNTNFNICHDCEEMFLKHFGKCPACGSNSSYNVSYGKFKEIFNKEMEPDKLE